LLSAACAALTFAIGCMVLVGWEAHVAWMTRVLPRSVAMRPLAAASFVLGAVALGLLLAGGRARSVGRAAGALVMLDGLGAVFEYAIGKDLHFDRLVFGRSVIEAGDLYPGKSSLDAAVAFVLLGFALLLSRPRGRLLVRDMLAAAAGTIAGVVALGYAYGATSLYGAPPFTMSLLAAVAICLLALGILLESPERGLLRMLVHGTVGGAVARRLVPVTTVLPIALSLGLILVGPHDLKLAAALLVAALVVTFTAVVLWNASGLELIDLERMRADENLRRATDVVSAVTGAALRRLSERDLLVNLCQRVKDLFETDTASILLADEQRRELVVAASVGMQAEVEAKIRVPFGHGVAGRIFVKGAPMMVPDLSQIDVVSPVLRENIRSMLGAPLVAPDGRTVGVIHVGTRRPRHFTEAEQRLMVLTADRLASAVTLAKTQQELRASEEHLRAERARLETILTSAPHGIVYVAMGGSVESNPAADRLTGYPPVQRMDGLRADFLRRPDGTPLPREEWPAERALRGEIVSRQELQVTRPDATRLPVLISGAPVRGPGDRVTGAVLAFEDITVFKELERLRDEFASIVAHDLRNPISSILMNAEVMLRQAQGRDTLEVRAAAVERIRRAAAHLGDMVKDLLDASRIEVDRLALDRKPLPSRTTVETIVEQVRPTLGEHPVKVATEGEPAPILVDPLRFDQILTNLLENAAKYSPRDAPIDVKVAPSEDGVEVSVKDEGMGIAPEDIPRLFDRFYQAKRAREMRAGLGLGLYITRGLVAAHGGRIWVDSEPAHGSTFHVWLPSAQHSPH
jgi:NtrC-family two-component system sensor histidine kinase KinB